MARSDINDIQAFLMVAKERNFTRAAAKLGISQSSLSHTVRRLEARLGIRLLARTTRSVAPTEAGERLLLFVSPRLDEIEGELNALTALRTSPVGNLRISAAEHATNAVLLPRLDSFLAQYPDIKLEVHLDNALTDIIAQGYDAGVRLGEQVAKDMIAVRVGPDWRMAVVGAPTYFAKVPAPSNPHDLSAHNCINLRLLTYGGLYAWEFERDGRRLNVRVEGQLTFSSSRPILDAAIAGHGLACIPEDLAGPALASGQLVRVMEEWCPTFVGYHLYYPNRRQPSPAFSLLVEALRYRALG